MQTRTKQVSRGGKKAPPARREKKSSKEKDVKTKEEAPVRAGDTPAGAPKNVRTVSLLRGMKDILPKEEYLWKRVYHTAEAIAGAYGFGMIETPVLSVALYSVARPRTT